MSKNIPTTLLQLLSKIDRTSKNSFSTPTFSCPKSLKMKPVRFSFYYQSLIIFKNDR